MHWIISVLTEVLFIVLVYGIITTPLKLMQKVNNEESNRK